MKPTKPNGAGVLTAEAPSVAQSTPDLERIFTMLTAFQQTAALRGAIELDLFTAIGEGNTDPDSLARRCQSSTRGVRVLCDYLTVRGLLTKEDGRYGLAPDAALFLDRQSPACVASTARFLNSPYLMECFQDVAGLVRKGGTLRPGGGSVAPDNPMWVDFAQCMVPLMMPVAEWIAERLEADGAPHRVLDIAAGHGMFGIAVARRHPEATVVAMDWPAVLQVARQNAERAGVADRYETLAGDAFAAEFGSGYDVVLLTNFLHHFDPATCERLLGKVHRCLQPGGRVITLEFVPNEDRVSPPIPAAFSLMMLGSTDHGQAYTFAELSTMFARAGFASTELHQPPRTRQQVLISRT
ncbi:MAG: class I SAM-dependent methyltransferase [Candidatus Latescibacterota bacterium]